MPVLTGPVLNCPPSKVCVSPLLEQSVHNGREELPDLVRSALFGAAPACRDLPAKRRSCCRLA